MDASKLLFRCPYSLLFTMHEFKCRVHLILARSVIVLMSKVYPQPFALR